MAGHMDEQKVPATCSWGSRLHCCSELKFLLEKNRTISASQGPVDHRTISASQGPMGCRTISASQGPMGCML